MLTLLLRFLALLLCLVPILRGGEPIPADCNWLLRIEVRALATSQAGAVLLEQLAKPPHSARLALLEAVSGLRIERDLDRVLVCGVGSDEAQVVVLAQGRFDAQRLLTLAQAAEHHRTVQVGLEVVHLYEDKGKTIAGCLARPDVLVFARSEARMRLALAALASPVAGALALPAGFEKAGIAACAAHDFAGWDKRPASNILKHLRSLALRLDEADGSLVLTGSATAATAEQAGQLGNLLRGLAALGQLDDRQDPAVAAALQSARIEGSGATVQVRLALPLEAVRRLVQQAAERRR